MTKQNKKNYECKECKMFYKNKILAENGFFFSKKKSYNVKEKYNSCNMEIIKYALKGGK